MADLDKKKILFVITKSNWGGAQHYVYELATHLSKEQYEVVVVCGGRGELTKLLRKAGIRTISVPYLERDITIFAELKVFSELIKIYRAEMPDIVHLNSSKIGGVGSLAGRIVRIQKIIFTAHGWAFNEDRSGLSKLIIRFISWLTIILSHRVITVSYNDAEQVLSLPFISAKKIHKIHTGIQMTEVGTKDTARSSIIRLSGKVTVPENTTWIGTVAELHKNKGLRYAIEACSHLNNTGHNFFFVIIGEGEERSSLEQLIREKGLYQRVMLVGHVENAAFYLKAFDVFILPSVKEGLPYVILEAGLAKLPTIASNVGGIPEIIEHKKNGYLITPKNSSQIEEMLEKLMHDREERERLGENLHEKIRTLFTLEHMVTETKKVYEY